MKFTVTALGGGRADTARVVDSIVRYLQPPAAGRSIPASAAPAAPSGIETYYADRGEEPGRWLGRTAAAAGLSGVVGREDFASALSGRDPHTGERLITAQGSAGRRPSLGMGTFSRVDSDGTELFDAADAAAVLGVTHREAERMLDAGEALGLADESHRPDQHQANAGPFRSALYPSGVQTGGPAGHPDGPPVQPEGSYLVSHPTTDGSRCVTRSELERCQAARDAGVSPDSVRSLGAGDDQLGLAEAARLCGMTARYLRGLATYHDKHADAIDQTIAAGRTPRKAYLVAHRGTRGQWLVTLDHLAEFLERRRPPAVRVAYDLTLTTEKSLGVLALLGDQPVQERVLGAIRAGNDWALRWLEDRAVGRIGGKAVPAEGLMIASFQHLTSRALDPFPHHHNVVINTVRAEDGTNRAVWSRSLYGNAHAASALATAQMRHQLSQALDVRWRPGRKSGWEIDGITSAVVSEFSKRRNEIDDALAELEAEIGRGAHPAEVEHIVLRTRPAKNHTPADALVNEWRQRAAAHGLTTDRLAEIAQVTATRDVKRDSQREVRRDVVFDLLADTDGICAGGSVFTRADAVTAIVNLGVPDPDGEPQPLLIGAQGVVDLTEEFLSSRHVVQLTQADEPMFTTTEMLAVQDRIAARFDKGRWELTHIVNDATLAGALAKHPHLTAEQRGLVTDWCQSGQRYQAAIGRAGTGKTTTVAACADAWRAAGYRVMGAAVKGEAARTLASATGIGCETVAWYLAHSDPEHPPLDAHTILVIDEASTLHDRALDTLMTMAADTGAAVRLIGDPAQHGAIAAGGMFRVLCEHHKPTTPELKTSHRLQDPHDRAAAEALRQGDIDKAFDQLAAAGHLHVVDDDLTMYRHVLGRWWDAHRRGDDHPMVDRRNTTRRQLNHLANLLRRVNGELGDHLPASGGRTFAVGDRVAARAPNRQLHVDGDHHAYIRNGATGTITAVSHDPKEPSADTITVDFDQIGVITVPRTFFDVHRTTSGRPEVGIDHAYALTSYAVQGSTRSVSTSRVDATATRAETYVDITRGRNANHLYLTTTNDPLDGEALPRLPTPPADHAVADRLQRSTGELTAWELAHPSSGNGQEQSLGR